MKTAIFTLFLFAAVVFTGFVMPEPMGGKDKNKDTKLRYDGVYYSNDVLIPGANKARNYTYLRFYPTGQVVRMSSASSPDRVAKWLTKDTQVKDGKGKFHLKNEYIDFDLKLGGQTISHEGSVLQDSLKLTVYGSLSKSSYDEMFYFVKVDMEN